ncbi:hypothetical protein AB0890_12635 [Streptomyces sp. NPDC005406]|uniref:hypothetical protein n=1 Tax=Streptomyces sp. NPDC005406 TaxID=3155339 RepID=UPI0034515C85
MICQLCEVALDDGMLCVGCTKATRVRLEALPTLYRGLGVLLTPAGGVGQGRSGKGGPAPIPVSLDVLDVRGPGGMVEPLESWVDAVRHDRGRPEHPHPGSPEGRVDRAVGELLGHMPWIAVSWPEAGDFAREIRELARAVSSMLRPPAADRGTRIGNCPAVDPSGALCGAVLRLAPGEKAVRCEWCDTCYPPYVWAQLKTWIDEDARASDAA